jgi:hypothetical protein
VLIYYIESQCRCACYYGHVPIRGRGQELGMAMCGGCGDVTHENDVRWCVSWDQPVRVLRRRGRGVHVARWGGPENGFDVCNACTWTSQHLACCGACGDITHSADLVWTDEQTTQGAWRAGFGDGECATA